MQTADSSTKHWGEFDITDDAVLTQADLTLPSNAAVNHRQFPSTKNKHKADSQINDGGNAELDPLVLHTIELRRVRRTLARREKRKQRPMPDYPEKRPPPPLGQPLSFIPADGVHEVVRRSCATLLAHRGFSDADAEALEVLTDVATERLQIICGGQLKTFHERRLNHGDDCAFSSAVQQTFRANGIDIADLKHYYETAIVEPHERLEADCRRLYAAKTASIQQWEDAIAGDSTAVVAMEKEDPVTPPAEL